MPDTWCVQGQWQERHGISTHSHAYVWNEAYAHTPDDLSITLCSSLSCSFRVYMQQFRHEHLKQSQQHQSILIQISIGHGEVDEQHQHALRCTTTYTQASISFGGVCVNCIDTKAHAIRQLSFIHERTRRLQWALGAWAGAHRHKRPRHQPTHFYAKICEKHADCPRERLEHVWCCHLAHAYTLRMNIHRFILKCLQHSS